MMINNRFYLICLIFVLISFNAVATQNPFTKPNAVILDAKIEPLTTQTFNISFADLTSTYELIKSLQILSDKGSILMNKHSNLLIVTDTKSSLTQISNYIKLIDKPVPQVHIAAHIVTMSDESSTELGIKWGYSDSSPNSNQFNIDLGIANPAAMVGFNIAKRASSLLNLELSALASENELEIIASPNLVTTNHHKASIKQGTQIPYEVSSGNNGATSIEFKHAVLGLDVTPKILNNDYIELTLLITQNTAGRTIKGKSGSEALAIDTQEIKTKVIVKNGETLILGGIFQQNNHQLVSHVPIISKIPILGSLFKHTKKVSQKRELVIFVTPKLMAL